ncbi:MAG: SpoIID/LytB domain-containing protein [Oscillospiraceae bacterium]|jgi:stage II sporulation protein D|nr:SpoIID/LytB domain-containing protein [Oscillospiraceae bacterium]
MKPLKRHLRIVAALCALALLLALIPGRAAAYVPQTNILKIGLYYGGSALQSANLQNVAGAGSGFEFGYFDATTREFVSVGAVTYETKITMLRDANMYGYVDSSDEGRYAYRQSPTSDTVVGCFHIQVPGVYPDFYTAAVTAESYIEGFVKYDSGAFVVCTGDYVTRADAEAAIASRGIPGSVTSGTSYTVSVVATGTGRVVFEFDAGATHALGVRPLATGGEKPQSWFKGYKYYGAFQYFRVDGQNLRVINFVDVEDYTKGLLPYEMSNTWPIEALKAQAVCARTYALSKLGAHGSSGFDLCATDHCQVYRGTGSANANTDRAVEETLGQYVTYNGALCETYYASCDGGATEDVENVWAQPLPYLRGVIDPYEVDIASRVSKYNWTVTYTPAELTSRLQGRGYSCGTITSLTVSQYTNNGNVYSVLIKDANGRSWTVKKDDVRIVLGTNSIRFTIGGGTQPGTTTSTDTRVYVNTDAGTNELNSGALYSIAADGTTQLPSDGALYAITGSGVIEEVGTPSAPTQSSGDGKINGVFVINGTGKGHNVGMSQWGAYAMANRGLTYRDIIHFYYTGVEIG